MYSPVPRTAPRWGLSSEVTFTSVSAKASVAVERQFFFETSQVCVKYSYLGPNELSWSHHSHSKFCTEAFCCQGKGMAELKGCSLT